MDEKPQVTALHAGEIKEINWTVKEYIGVEVYQPPAGLTLEEIRDRSNWPEDFQMEPIKDEALKVGDLLLVPGLFGDLFYGTVEEDRGSPYFRSHGGSMMGILEYGIDDRDCWTCGGLFNAQAIQRLKLEK